MIQMSNSIVRKSWNQFFLEKAQHASTKSKDPSTQCGVVIVRGTSDFASGFNGFPIGVREVNREGEELHWDGDLCQMTDLIEERWARPDKYLWCEHAERNAIYQAARYGFATDGATMFLSHRGNPGICEPCARGIIQSGIRKVIMPEGPMFAGRGEGDHYTCNDGIASVMLEEAGVEIEVAEGVYLC